jgi:hypothetical protein
VAGRVFEDLLPVLELLDEMYGRGEGGVVVAGPSECVMMLLDNAMVPYSDVKAVAPAYHAVVAEGWRAERLLELFGLGEGGRAPLYYIATCTVRGRCVYYLYEVATREGLYDVASHLTTVILLARLITAYSALGLCRGERASEVYEDCVKRIIESLLEVAEKRGDKTLPNIIRRFDSPMEVFCTPEMFEEHKGRA